MTKSIPEIVEEFEKHLEAGAREYGTTYPPHPELIRWLTQTLQAERQRCEEMVEAEAYRWFNTWYALTIDEKESVDGFYGFGQFAVHRLQEIGASDITQPNNPK